MSNRPEDLTERERTVLEGRIAGESRKEIAARLGISPSTVGVFQHRAVRKLGTTRIDVAKRRWRDYVADEAVRAATE